MASGTRLLMIGLDSAEPELLDRWCDDGVLPALARLRARGFVGRVVTPPGMGNGALWPSIFTGANPGRHGRYFRYPVAPGTYGTGRFDADRGFGARPFWERLSAEGRRVGIIDMVVAPLSPALNGIQVADWTTHDAVGPPRSTPPELIHEITRDFGRDPLEGNGDVPRDRDGYRLLRDQMLARIAAKTECTLRHLAEGPWDFFAVAYGEPHDIGHQCWHLHDPTHPRYDAALGDPIRAVYVALDAAVDRLWKAVGPDTPLVVFSGPGMGPPHSGNHLLEEILRRLDAPRRTARMRAVSALRAAYRAVVPARMREKAAGPVAAVAQRAHVADMSRRRFYSVIHNQNAGAVRLNVVGREPHGCVPAGEIDAACDALEAELRALVNLDHGGPVVDDVVRVARRYHGPCVATMPDLLVVWRRDRPIEAVGSPRIGEVRGRRATAIRTGDHTPRAVLMVHGPGIPAARAAEAIAAEAVAPTLAALLGVDLHDADGLPIAELVAPIHGARVPA